MGFRIDISCKDNPDIRYYGTKLYGYVNDESKLRSWKFLYDNDKLKELISDTEHPLLSDPRNIWWDGCFITSITLNNKEFGLFIGLYTEDLCDKYDTEYALSFLKEVIPLLAEPGDKLITWG